ncbi:MAG: pyridoxal phosphate-dependent aminotransferase [Deltaproteobacteria bacterium]|nr:pyridoxal phosphate-dependent aminotransferase [Deltaproteobacteria bacterium]
MTKRLFSHRSGVNRGPNRLTVALEQERQKKRDIIDLTLSNPTLARLPFDAQALLDALSNRDLLVYRPDPLGLRSAREAVASHISESGLSTSADRIVLTASTSDAYAYLIKLFCDPGDELLVPKPSYPLFEHLARLEAVRLKPYPLRYDGLWHIAIDEVEAALTRRTKAIVVVSPNNPTGSFLKRDELDALSKLGLPLISDEVFSSYPLINDRTRVRSALESDQTLVFALFGLSKLAALPQLKLAWICIGGPETLAEEARERLELIADTFLSVGTAIQLAVPQILKIYQPVSDAIRRRTKRNLDALSDLDWPVSLFHLEGGWYASLKLPNIESDEQWALDFLNKDQVCVYPGYFFDYERSSVIVISLLVAEPIFDEGLRRLAARVGATVKKG